MTGRLTTAYCSKCNQQQRAIWKGVGLFCCVCERHIRDKFRKSKKSKTVKVEIAKPAVRRQPAPSPQAEQLEFDF